MLISLFVTPNALSAQQPSNLSISVVGARSNYKDSSGRQVYEIEPGQHFTISVIHIGKNRINEPPTITGINQFKNVLTQSTPLHPLNINGRIVLATSFEYQAMAEEEGEFELGPAITHSEESESCVIKVRQRSQQEADSDFEKEYTRGAACQARLTAEKQTFFVGETIALTLKVYLWNDQVEIDNIIPQLDTFTVKESEAEIEYAQIDRRKIRVVKKKYFLSTPWIGTKQIKPITIAYSEMENFFGLDRHGFHSGGVSFFNAKRSSTLSNGLTITIENPPAGKRSPDGIGQFSQLSLSVDKNMVDLRNPINLTVKIVGTGNFDNIETPRLKLPKQIRSFPGATEGKTTQNCNTGEHEKKFTYVIQPLKAGVLKIPAQEFYFFNPQTKEYASVYSNEITITVDDEEEPQPTHEKTAPPEDEVNEPEHVDKEIQHQELDSESYDFETGATDELSTPTSKIPSWLIALVAAMSFGLGAGYFAISAWINWKRRNPTKALALTLRELKLSKVRTAKELFRIMLSYYKLKLFNDQSEDPTFDQIETALIDRNCKKQIVNACIAFAEKLAVYVFGTAAQHSNTQYDALRTELEKILKTVDPEL
jgi:hypothetical protein